jgi:CDP-glycerol glycerophosphotransferase (TagB/SpsB family)
LFDYIKRKGIIGALKEIPNLTGKRIRIGTFLVRKVILRKKIVLFYIDEPLLFACTQPVWRGLQKYGNLDMYFTVVGQRRDRTIGIMREGGVKKTQIITLAELMKINFADLFVSATPFCSPPVGKQLNVSTFHGLSSKGQDFPDSVMNFDVLFLTSSVLKSLYNNVFLKNHPGYSKHILFEVGFPKLDDVFNKKYDRGKLLNQLGLDKSKPTVLYAPTWVKDGSLSLHGKEIIRTLLDMDVNLIVKLHPSIYNCDPKNPDSFSLVGDTDWEKELREFEKRKNYRNILETDSNPYLVLTDILVTDISGIALEFMILNRPIIFFDVPELFMKALPRIFGLPETDAKDAYLNPLFTGGREAGLIVKSVAELKEAVNRSIKDPGEMSLQRKHLAESLYYNPGRASEVSVKLIMDQLSGNHVNEDNL